MPPRRGSHDALAHPADIMALDLGLTTRQLLSALDDMALASRTHAQRLTDTLERGLNISADAATRRTAAVGRRPCISARTGPEGLLFNKPTLAVGDEDLYLRPPNYARGENLFAGPCSAHCAPYVR